MREEDIQKSSCETSDETWDRGAQTLEKLIPLEEAAFKRLSVDSYSIQLANARNYLWISVLLMTAGVAFFDRSGLGYGPFGFLSCASIALLVLMFLGALMAFIRGIDVMTGTDDVEPTMQIADHIRGLEQDSYSAERIYDERINLLVEYVRGIQGAGEGLNRRGRQLRLAGLDVRFSMGCGLGALLFHWLSRL